MLACTASWSTIERLPFLPFFRPPPFSASGPKVRTGAPRSLPGRAGGGSLFCCRGLFFGLNRCRRKILEESPGTLLERLRRRGLLQLDHWPLQLESGQLSGLFGLSLRL